MELYREGLHREGFLICQNILLMQLLVPWTIKYIILYSKWGITKGWRLHDELLGLVSFCWKCLIFIVVGLKVQPVLLSNSHSLFCLLTCVKLDNLDFFPESLATFFSFKVNWQQ